MKLFYIFLFTSLFSSIACDQKETTKKNIAQSEQIPIASESSPKKTEITKEKKIKDGTGELVAISSKYPEYGDAHLYAKDSILKSGWNIKYFIKDDTTRYRDLYIECSLKDKRSVFFMEDVLEMRRYFIPEFVTETATHIFFEHGCATGCFAILAFSKEKMQFQDYLSIVDSDLELGQLLYISDISIEKEGELFEMILVDFSRNKEYLIHYDHICGNPSFKPACVKEVIFGKEKVIIEAKLRRSLVHSDSEIFTRTISLN